jgi:hypothetical protein
MSETSVRRGLIAVLAAATLFLGGCCDKCGKQIGQLVKTAFLILAENAAQCCNTALTAQQASECLGERQDTLDDVLALIIAADVACNQGNNELMNQIIQQIIDRILGPNSPIPGLSASVPVSLDRFEVVNALPLFGCEEQIEVLAVATADGQWRSKTTAVVNGREVMPEAAGNAAIEDERLGLVAEASVADILLANEPEALQFATYTIGNGSHVRYQLGQIQMDFALSGSIEVGTFAQGADNSVTSLPGAAKLQLSGPDGSITLSLDKTQPANTLVVGPDGTGVLSASFAIHGTNDFDFLPSLYERVWLEIPLVIDPDDLSLDFVLAGPRDGCDIAPYWSASGQSDGDEPAPDGFPRACDMIDTDDDGVPDTTRIRHDFEQAGQRIMEQICED